MKNTRSAGFSLIELLAGLGISADKGLSLGCVTKLQPCTDSGELPLKDQPFALYNADGAGDLRFHRRDQRSDPKRRAL